jgi:hypothetical protein
MPAELVFADLFAFGHVSLAWVRVYRRQEGEAVALALNLEDNPGPSVVNDAEGLLAGLSVAFSSLGQLRVFARFPDDPRDQDWTEIVKADTSVDFSRYAVEKVEGLVDAKLVDPTDATCSALAGEHHPLLKLIPPPEPERNRLDDMAVVAIGDLPWPHHPGACHWKERFEQLHSLYPAEHNDRPALGAHWYLTLTKADFEACRYHQADWKRIAEVSVDIFQGLGESAVIDDVLDGVARILGDSPEGKWCASLFRDPIIWPSGHSSVANGQHRSCALRASGASLCVVDVEGAFVTKPVASDPRRRAAAEVASYWARRAAL